MEIKYLCHYCAGRSGTNKFFLFAYTWVPWSSHGMTKLSEDVIFKVKKYPGVGAIEFVGFILDRLMPLTFS